MKSIAPNIALIEAFTAISRSATTYDQTGMDLSLYHGQLDAFISVGNVNSTGTLDAKWQESDDNSTFTDCSGADNGGNAVAITQITAAGTARLKRSVRKFTKRYARIRLTVATAAVVAAVVVAAFPNKSV